MNKNYILQFETVLRGLKNGQVFTHDRLDQFRSRFIKLKTGYFIDQYKINGSKNIFNLDDHFSILLRYGFSGTGGLPFVITNDIFLEPERWHQVLISDFKKYCPENISEEKRKVLKKNFKKLFS